MQIDRLLETLLYLLKYKKTTAADLAQRFAVSVRTIYRDIDALSLAGIPVYCIRGNHGGIFLDEDYLVERNYLTRTEKEQMNIALQLLKATNLLPVDHLLQKYDATLAVNDSEWLVFELADGNQNNELTVDLTLLKTAITERRMLRFIYCSEHGQTSLRTAAPAKIIYRQQNWYLLGYCQDNHEYQLYALNHLKELTLLNQHAELPQPVLAPEINTIVVRLRFSKRLSYKQYGDFYGKALHWNDDGSYELELSLLNDDSLYSYLLSFGNNVEILSPLWLKKEMIHKINLFLENNQI